tara:strand:- start:53 stop:739 length:687 start_codon:yes stop_codon:yes gene_type:complete
MKPETRLKQILTRLESPTLKDEYYVIKGKSYHSADTSTDDYLIHMNNTKLNEGTPIISPPIITNNEIEGYSFRESLSIEVKLAKTELELKNCERELKELQEYCNTLENKIDDLELETLDDSSSNVDNIKTFLTETLTLVAPMIDKHLELKEKKLDILSQQKPMNEDAKDVIKEVDQIIRQVIENHENEDIKGQLKIIYNTEEDYGEMFRQFSALDPTVTEQIQAVANG